MPSSPVTRDDGYQAALKQLNAAIDAYGANPSVENLIAVYEAQNTVRNAADNAGVSLINSKPVDKKTVDGVLKLLRDPSTEAVPGAHLGMAEALLQQLQQQASGTVSIEQTRQLGDATRQVQDYISQATARIQENDGQFADDYMRITGQPPPPGRFSSGQTIGATPTPQPTPGIGTGAGEKTVAGVKRFMPSGSPGVPDEGARPPSPVDKTPPKRTRGQVTQTGQLNVEPLPWYAPYDAQTDYNASPGMVAQPPDVGPGTNLAPPRDASGYPVADQNASDSIKNAYAQTPQSAKYNIFRSGVLMGQNMDAIKSGRLVFTGYQTRNTKYIDESNPRLGSQITTTKTPSYQSTAGLQYALGQQGFPTVAEFQKAMGLPVTNQWDLNTMDKWNNTIQIAAINTASGNNMTVQQAIQLQANIAKQIAAQQRAAMAAAYNVDPTASAAILGSAMKQITGRLSTAGEDAEFHRAFNSANISTQGKVDAQQFARDWVRNKYPTEAGTMAGQDYYGAMFDVLTSGPGSLGSQAADING